MKVKMAYARVQIIEAANATRNIALEPFTARHINQAVFKCRQRGLVEPDVLTAAGFRSKRRSN